MFLYKVYLIGFHVVWNQIFGPVICMIMHALCICLNYIVVRHVQEPKWCHTGIHGLIRNIGHTPHHISAQDHGAVVGKYGGVQLAQLGMYTCYTYICNLIL